MINLIAPINTLGYGYAGLNFVKELFKHSQRITLYPIANKVDPIDTTGIVQTCLNNQVNHNPEYPCVKIWHQHDLQQRVGCGKYYGFPIFELNKFSTHEKVSLHHCDEIIVCSHWARDIVISETKFKEEQIHVVPLGVDKEIFKPATLNPRSTTVFFNCGKWEKRKGHDVLLRAFNEAFTEEDDVELWVMADNPFIEKMNDQWASLYKNSPLGNKIRIIPRQKTHEDVYNIMRLSDCGVFPSKAEGWNLEVLEMMAIGKAVITTNYSAHTEFCNKENSMLVEIQNLETAFDGVFFNGDVGFWAEIADNQIEEIKMHMLDIYRKKQSGKLEINYAGIETANKFSWENSAKELINVCGL
jgi:glycosyltransferase involved in cell wall biosynthesis